MIKPILFLTVITQFVFCKQADNKHIQNNNLSSRKEGKNHQLLKDTVRGDFNKDNKIDYIQILNKSPEEKHVKIFLQRENNKFSESKSFIINDEYFTEVENPVSNLFISKGRPGEIIIGTSCCGNFKTTEIYYYKFIKDNWYLYKTSTSTIDDDFIPKVKIDMNSLSNSIDNKTVDNKNIYNKEIQELKESSLSNFTKSLVLLKSANKTNTLSKQNTVGLETVAEWLYFNPLNENNLNDYNDIAYYNSYTKGGNITSIFLLKEIIEKHPNRVVAYLNLGDSYWNADNKEKAKEAYLKYIELMKSQKKDISKIPQKVYDRTK
ncbi:tetratricopeptide repeat protein [Chryseobacterium sp. c4a]|uniref:tetratricopeptide repeat protein n=1 Tax=Chryseobacterium sp. c4a TaxID=1573582 RepID=UPI00135B2A9D|nr:tetratricopeptide repeat protein [Chryseobacterium sp. c4a]